MAATELLTRKSPLEAGFDSAVTERLNAHIKWMIENKKVQCGSYMLARGGSVFASGAFGPLKYEGPAPEMNESSIRRIASVTKLFTATAIFQLIESGKLFLRQPVAEWIEEFKNPMYERIQILHLLTHTSGLQADPFYYLEPYPMGWRALQFAYEPETEGPFAVTDPERFKSQKKVAWIKSVLSGKPLSEPGEKWNYSSSGFAILGEIVTRASGIPFETYVMDKIVKPLGMSRTFFNVPEELHSEVCVITEDEAKGLSYRPSEYASPRAGGGLYSTLADLFVFGQMFLNGGTTNGARILSRKSVEKMTSNVLGGGIDAFCWGGRIKNMTYGAGPLLVGKGEYTAENTFGHEGAGRCKLLIDREKGAVIVFFVPSNVDWAPESMVGMQNVIGSGWL